MAPGRLFLCTSNPLLSPLFVVNSDLSELSQYFHTRFDFMSVFILLRVSFLSSFAHLSWTALVLHEGLWQEHMHILGSKDLFSYLCSVPSSCWRLEFCVTSFVPFIVCILWLCWHHVLVLLAFGTLPRISFVNNHAIWILSDIYAFYSAPHCTNCDEWNL